VHYYDAQKAEANEQTGRDLFPRKQNSHRRLEYLNRALERTMPIQFTGKPKIEKGIHRRQKIENYKLQPKLYVTISFFFKKEKENSYVTKEAKRTTQHGSPILGEKMYTGCKDKRNPTI
jgi:hypothetical protein